MNQLSFDFAISCFTCKKPGNYRRGDCVSCFQKKLRRKNMKKCLQCPALTRTASGICRACQACVRPLVPCKHCGRPGRYKRGDECSQCFYELDEEYLRKKNRRDYERRARKKNDARKARQARQATS